VKSKPIQELDYSSNRQDKPMKVLKKKKKKKKKQQQQQQQQQAILLGVPISKSA
jgi:hypothetical protein